MKITHTIKQAWHHLKTHPQGVLYCSLTGVMTFMAFPNAWSPQLNLWWLMWISHIPVLYWLKGRSTKFGFYWGYLTGIIINAGGYYWIAELSQTFGGLPIWMGFIILMLHSLLVGFIWAVWGMLVCALSKRYTVQWVAPTAMVCAEFFMPRIFPAYMGNCQYPFLEIMQIADIFGMGAVTWILYRFNTELSEAVYRWRQKIRFERIHLQRIIITVFLVVTPYIYGVIRIPQVDQAMQDAAKIKVGVVEADIGILSTESRSKRQNHLLILQQMSQQLAQQGAELIIWSESAYRVRGFSTHTQKMPVTDLPLVDDYRIDLAEEVSRSDRSAPLRGFKTALLFGASSYQRQKGQKTKRYNSAWLIDKESQVLGRYDKIYRLVFGEYIPLGETFPKIYNLLPYASHTSKGESVHSLTLPREDGTQINLGILICYEGIIPEFNRGLLDSNPDMLINITNDDWFGLSAERYLHFVLALPRAIESRRPMIRSTLTGVSAIIDANGRILDWTSPKDPEVLLGDIPLMRAPTLYMSIGDLLPYSCLTFIIIALYYKRKQDTDILVKEV